MMCRPYRDLWRGRVPAVLGCLQGTLALRRMVTGPVVGAGQAGCEWVIRATAGKEIVIAFSSFSVGKRLSRRTF